MAQDTVLIVDDDPLARAQFRDALKDGGWRIIEAPNGEEALQTAMMESIDVVLLDLVMPRMGGLDLIPILSAMTDRVEVIVVTGLMDVEPAVKAMQAGARDYLTKPINPETLRFSVKHALEAHHLYKENEELKHFVRLFDSFQKIGACVDARQLPVITNQALTAECGAGIAITYRLAGEGADAPVCTGLSPEEGRAAVNKLAGTGVLPMAPDFLVDALPPARGRDLPFLFARPNDEYHMLLVRYSSGQVDYGGTLLMRPGRPFTRNEIMRASLLRAQILNSWSAALRLEDARKAAYLDNLTGLYNARQLEESVPQWVDRHKADETPFSILFLDVDRFKHVNDTYGHLIGSRLLVEVASVLKRCIRGEDVAVRYGGDEFVLLLDHADTEIAMRVAERIRKSIESHQFLSREKVELKITACIGVATFPVHADTGAQILHAADEAMYRGKRGNRNSVFLADHISKDTLGETLFERDSKQAADTESAADPVPAAGE
ncbi:MAG: Response regulator PleD [Myxococcota bacterium]|nr:Response regulator PleD [Myxococcota bacterium]